jgi:hypothetical protein
MARPGRSTPLDDTIWCVHLTADIDAGMAAGAARVDEKFQAFLLLGRESFSSPRRYLSNGALGMINVVSSAAIAVITRDGITKNLRQLDAAFDPVLCSAAFILTSIVQCTKT